MQYPTFAEYTDALQLNLGIVLSDPLLSRGRVRTHGPGLPFARSGNFALTFEVRADGQTYALRCFHKPSDTLRLRYDAIALHLGRIGSPYFVDFDFQPRGITTESGTYPIVRMEWAEGANLGQFVATHRHDTSVLQELRLSLRGLARHLRNNGIAHGDIQPTNLILSSPSYLKLIDYDGMFVPGLEGLRSAELGQRNFQHPGRRSRHFDAALDAFSFAVLDVALDALCIRADLWDLTTSGEDAFILRAADFADPASSPVFSLLSGIPELEPRVRQLASVCVSPFEAIPSFEDFLAGRNVPAVSVVFSGDATLSLRRPYVSPFAVVDASDFVACCGHVGDRVELIGRVTGVTQGHLPRRDATHVRVEFGEPGHDMACLKVWPEDHPNLERLPDETWVGQWVSAVGLVEPVYTAPQGARRQKDVSIAITEQSQLQTLTEAEAIYRLRGRGGRSLSALDSTGAVVTDPAMHDEANAPAPPPRPQNEPSATSSDLESPTTVASASPPIVADPTPRPQGVPRTLRAGLAAIVIAGAGVILFMSYRHAHRSPGPQPVSQAVRPAHPAAAPVAAQFQSQQALTTNDLPVRTVAGALDVATAAVTAAKRAVVLDGQPIASLHDDAISLVNRATFTDRDVITGFTTCRGETPPCGLKRPFWLELRAGAPPVVRRLPNLWASSSAGSVTADARGVRVELGIWNGEQRVATLTTAGELDVARSGESIRPLSAADCAIVLRSLESCAASKECSTFANAAQRVAADMWVKLDRTYHETTGLDAAAFQALCLRSCQLGLTPSRAFVRKHACMGASPGQWPTDEPAAGLLKRWTG